MNDIKMKSMLTKKKTKKHTSKYSALKAKYDKLKETIDGIQSVLDKYFEDGNSSDYNPYYSAQDAIDDIASLL